jgi:hypothetical protein
MLTSTNDEKQDVMDFVMEDASHHWLFGKGGRNVAANKRPITSNS